MSSESGLTNSATPVPVPFAEALAVQEVVEGILAL